MTRKESVNELVGLSEQLLSDIQGGFEIVESVVVEAGRNERNVKRLEDNLRLLELWHLDVKDRIESADDRLRRLRREIEAPQKDAASGASGG